MYLSLLVTSIFTTKIIVAQNQMCPPIPKVYEEFGCVGKDLDKNNCPIRYECPDINTYDPEKCYYKGKTYLIGEELLKETSLGCLAACHCSGFNMNDDNFASFRCANIECGEDIDPDSFEDCLIQKKIGDCCANNFICDEGDKVKLAKCHYQGSVYHDGQLFYPKDSDCYHCICDKNFDSKKDVKENKNCQRIDCGIEVLYWDKMKKLCAPIYYKSSACCPISFRCPSDDDQIIPFVQLSVDKISTEYACKFGNLTLHQGQKLNSSNECVECTCTLPPLVECIIMC